MTLDEIVKSLLFTIINKVKYAKVILNGKSGLKFLLRYMFWKSGLGFPVRLIRKALIISSFKRIWDKNTKIFIMKPMVAWNVPLVQRPQHLAVEFAKKNTYIFGASLVYDGDVFLRKIRNNLFLTSYYSDLKKFLLAQNLGKKLIFHCYAHDPALELGEIEEYLNLGATVLYEYIDALDENLTRGIEKIRDRHNEILKDERVHVVVTASRLLSEVARKRRSNFILVPNGVDFNRFNCVPEKSIPVQISRKVQNYDFTIGYFGAFASWFDFKLIAEMARVRKDIHFLLVGWDYDGSLAKKIHMIQLDNISVIGPIPYPELPAYAQIFDVGIIPFLVNEITLSTNPIKMYEYMALGLPVVSSELPECIANEHILIARGLNDWLDKVKLAFDLKKDQNFVSRMYDEAKKNTWSMRASEIDSVLFPMD